MAHGGGGLRGGVSRLALAEARSRHSAGGAGYIPGLRVETSPLAGKGKKAIGLDAGVCVCGGECGHMDHDRCYGSPSARAPASVPPTLPENREYLTVTFPPHGLTLRYPDRSREGGGACGAVSGLAQTPPTPGPETPRHLLGFAAPRVAWPGSRPAQGASGTTGPWRRFSSTGRPGPARRGLDESV